MTTENTKNKKLIRTTIFLLTAAVAISFGFYRVLRNKKSETITQTPAKVAPVKTPPAKAPTIDRYLTPQLAAQLDQLFPEGTNKIIVITCIAGDKEGYNFANQIKDYLKAKNITVKGVRPTVFSETPVGQDISASEGSREVRITIGKNI